MRLTPKVRNWLMAPIAIMLISIVVAAPAIGAEPIAGSQGTDTSLPLTDSPVTVSGRGDFEALEITINQTKDLTNQAVSITWRGALPTRAGAGRFSAHYLQVMQCWGDDDGTNTANPGPPPEQCVQGAVAGRFGGLPGSLYPVGFGLSRVISRSNWDNFNPSVGFLDAASTNVWRPFRAVDGTVINSHTDPSFNPSVSPGNFWQNPYFDIVTTNEIAGGVTRANGSGAELFQVLNGVQSTGLGCGQRVQLVNGSPQIPKCWLVIVPRGEPAVENADTPFADEADQIGVATSPVAPSAWANRIAVPLEFTPVDSPCRLGDNERQISGNEMFQSAVASWQPALCGGGRLPPFSYAAIGDPGARRQITSPTVGSPGLVAVSQPIPASQASDRNPVVYAPLTASGVAIGFNIERVPKPTSPTAAQLLSGVRVADLNLTPRLVAKLLTQSYSLSVRILEKPDYDWVDQNPSHMGLDPDFVQFNPEFSMLGNGDRNFSSLTFPTGNSDAAKQLWEWVLSDPEARAWLDGQPDKWGMRVNPVYSTIAANNSSGFPFAATEPLSFPKADPYCYRSGPIGAARTVIPPPLCGTDWLPYARSFEEAATMTRAAYDRARVVLNTSAPDVTRAWSRSEPQFLGFRTFLSVTDTSSAARYGLQTARLSRAGDNRDDRTFVGPTTQGLSAGVESMKPREIAAVREPAVLAQPVEAYPLTPLTYAAVAPLALDTATRTDYANFVRYAATDGQVPGTKLGNLPVGYLPLPDSLTAQALTTADAIVALQPTPAPAATPAAPTPAPATLVPIPTQVPASEETPSVSTPQQPTAGTPSASTPGRRAETTSSAAATAPLQAEGTVPESTVAETPPEEAITEDKQPDQISTPAAVATPGEELGAIRYAVPVTSGVALVAALAALELTKRPRRMRPGQGALGAFTAGGAS